MEFCYVCSSVSRALLQCSFKILQRQDIAFEFIVFVICFGLRVGFDFKTVNALFRRGKVKANEKDFSRIFLEL